MYLIMNDTLEMVEILRDVISILLATISILITVGTVVYSFMLSKRESLKIHAENKKQGNSSFDLDRAILAEKNYIERMLPLFRGCIYLIVTSTLLLLLDYVAVYLLHPTWFVVLMSCLSVLTILITIVYLVRQFIVLARDIRLEKKE